MPAVRSKQGALQAAHLSLEVGSLIRSEDQGSNRMLLWKQDIVFGTHGAKLGAHL